MIERFTASSSLKTGVMTSKALRTSEHNNPSLCASLIHGVGEMADLVRATDWSQTPLGPMDAWPETLVSSVNLILGSRFPAAIFWGPRMIQLYNDAYQSLLAEKHPNALGQAASECWKEAWHIVGPQLEATLLRGESIRRENVLIPVLRGRALEDAWWTYSSSPICGPGAEISGILTICHDVTEEVAAKRDRDALSEQLHQVLEATTDAVVSIDRQWRMTYMNRRAREIVAPRGDVIGLNIWETFPHLIYDGSPYEKYYRRAMNEGLAGEFEAYYPDPLNIWVHVNARPSKDGIVFFFRDITLVKRTETALKESEKLATVGRLAASIAHEINNPLESVTNLLFLALNTTNRDELHKYLQIAERELTRVSAITNQTLRFYRQSTSPRTVPCEELIDSVLAIHHRRILNSRVQVDLRLRATRPLNCFEGEIRQVLNNLIGNAIDAMPQGGRLCIRSREGTHWPRRRYGLILTVADTGSGIPTENLRKIFEPFFSTKGPAGTGLGLWVSHEIVQRHQGIVHVRSSQRSARRGTVFTLFLPFDGIAHATAA
jgi:PAS domain S-box-containing protein